MSDTPKFEVIDRRKIKKEEEQDSALRIHQAAQEHASLSPSQKSAGTATRGDRRREDAKAEVHRGRG